MIKIKSSLENFNIPCSNVNLSKKKGTISPINGYPLNEDYWAISVNQKLPLLELLYELKKYSRHGDKRKAIDRALTNISNMPRLWKPI